VVVGGWFAGTTFGLFDAVCAVRVDQYLEQFGSRENRRVFTVDGPRTNGPRVPYDFGEPIPTSLSSSRSPVLPARWLVIPSAAPRSRQPDAASHARRTWSRRFARLIWECDTPRKHAAR
jgi:hypothetical protein